MTVKSLLRVGCSQWPWGVAKGSQRPERQSLHAVRSSHLLQAALLWAWCPCLTFAFHPAPSRHRGAATQMPLKEVFSPQGRWKPEPGGQVPTA